MTKDTPIVEGSCLVDLHWNAGWPVRAKLPMFKSQVGASLFGAVANSDGTITVTVCDASGREISGQTPELEIHSELLKIGAAWNFPNDISFCLNGQILISLLDAPVIGPVSVPSAKLKRPRNFAAANTAAREKRIRVDIIRVPKKGRRLRSLDEELQTLQSATKQLADLVKLIEGGQFHHVHGCIALIRSLIARGGWALRPLLQRLAAHVDIPLVVFAPLHEDDIISTMPETPSVYTFLVAPVKHREDDAEIDLDVWLESDGYKLNDETLSQNKLIRTISDSLASHFDPDSDPQLDQIEQVLIYSEGTSVSMVVGYTHALGKCVVSLSDQVLDKFREIKQASTSTTP